MTAPARPRPILVTGAGGGIGAAVVDQLTGAGHPVVATDRDGAAAERVAAAVPSEHAGQAVAVELDVTSLASVQAATRAGVEAFGGLGGVVNNAGWLRPEALADTDDELIRQTIAINLEGPLRVTRECLPELIAHRSGRIVNVASDGALAGMSHISAYAAAKGGLLALTRALALELGRHQITVNTVSPGPTRTPLLDATADHERMTRGIPLERLGEPGDVAGAIAYFCSEAAAFVTGQTIAVSGGLTRP